MSQVPHTLYIASVLPKRSETFVYREVLGLRACGYEVSIASVNPPEQELEDPALQGLSQEVIPVYGEGVKGKLAVARDAFLRSPVRIPAGISEVAPSYWPKYQLQCDAGYALAKRVSTRGITHIHAHMAHVPTTVAMHCARALGVPFSFTGHAADLFRDRSALKAKLKEAAFVACISHWHRDLYNSLVPRPNDAYPIVRCGVDVNQFKPQDGQIRRGMLAVGRLVRKKGFDLLIEAYARANIQTRLTIVGDGPERKSLAMLIKKHNLETRIELVGAKSNDTVRELMATHAIFVLPCRIAEDGDRDGIPVVLMEAMASGMSVISGDIVTIRELVAHEQTGLMVEPGDIDSLANSLHRLEEEQALFTRLALTGRKRVVEEFSMSVNLNRLIEAFKLAS